MSELYDKMIGKTISGYDDKAEDLRIDFTDGTHIDLNVCGGDGGICEEWIDDQEVNDRARSMDIMARVIAFSDEARGLLGVRWIDDAIGRTSPQVVKGWNGHYRPADKPDLTQEEQAFMKTREGK